MKSRLLVAGVLLGLAAIVVVPLLIFQFGRHDPSPASLTDQPNPAIPGEILYFDEDGCVVRAKASGEDTRVATCDISSSPASFVTWLGPDTIAVAQSNFGKFGPPGGTFAVSTLNLRTGDRGTGKVESSSELTSFGGPQAQESVHGERVSVSPSGEVTILAGTSKTEIADFDVAEYRTPQFLTWSPDGEWMLLSYWDDDSSELWVLSRNGKTRGTLSSGLRQPVASWYIEGQGAWPKVEIEFTE